MKLYKGIPIRLAKKCIKHSWNKLSYGLSLKPGDLISTCKGYNERIAKITPDKYTYRKGWVIVDFDIITTVGSSHSLISCCSFPLETREQIIEYMKGWASPESVAYCEKTGFNFHKCPIVQGVMAGEDVFDENGEPNYEYISENDRKIRFPERLEKT